MNLFKVGHAKKNYYMKACLFRTTPRIIYANPRLYTSLGNSNWLDKSWTFVIFVHRQKKSNELYRY